MRRSVARPLVLLLAALLLASTAPAALAAQIPTTTTLTLPPGPVQIDAPITFSAMVTPAPTSGVVGFLTGGRLLISVTIEPDGSATGTLPQGLWEGDHIITAMFMGSDTHEPSTSEPQVLPVVDDRLPVSVTLTSGPNPSIKSDPVALHAVVTPDPGGGSVDYYWRPGSRLGESPVGAGGVADHTGWFAAADTYHLTACFSGNATYHPACSPVVDQVVVGIPTTTTLTITPATIYPDESMTFKVVISPPPETPEDVWIGEYPGQHQLAIGIDPVTGRGEVTILPSFYHPFHQLGTRDLHAEFAGTAHQDASVSAPVRLTVRLDPATIEPSVGPDFTTVGDPLTFSARVDPLPTDPSAAVGFGFSGPPGSGFGDHVWFSIGPDATGQVTVDTDGWPAGEYWYDATYGGDPHLEPVTVRGAFTLIDVEPPEGDIDVGDGADTVIDDEITVEVPAEDGDGSGVTTMALSNDGTTWTTMPYTPEVEWGLLPGDGMRTISAKWRDQAGNWSSVVSDSVLVKGSIGIVGAPTVALVAGASLSSGRPPARVSWSAASGAGGIVTYRLEQRIDTGPWTVAATGLTSTSTLRSISPGHAYRFRVQAEDLAGGLGPMAVQSTLLKVTGYSELSSAVKYSGTWSSTASTAYWGGKAKSATAAGAKATFTFTGRSVAIVSRLAPGRGKAEIWIGSTKMATIDLYSASYSNQRIVWSKAWTTSAKRTVTIKVLGTAGRPRVEVDGFLVGS